MQRAIVTTMTMLVVSLAIVSLTAASSVQTWTGTIMCRVAHHPDRYARVCPSPSDRYVFLGSGVVYDIKHQGFSSLSQLTGIPLRVTGEVKGHVIDLLQVMELPLDYSSEDE